MNLSALYKKLAPYTDILLFAVCLFGANAFWKWAVEGDDSNNIVTVFGANATPYFNACAQYVAERVATIIHLFRPTVCYFEPDIIAFSSGFISQVAWSCTAIKQSFIWLIIMLFARGKRVHKLWFIPLGWLFIHGFNLLRISLINMLCEFHPDRFVFWHEYFFKYLFYLMLFLLWVLWNESPRLHPTSNER